MMRLEQSYSDILLMPTCERRFHLGLLSKKHEQTQEELEKRKEQSQIKNGKGNRTTRVSGEALKQKIKSGEVK